MVCSYSRWDVSFVPTGSTILLMEVGSEGIRSRSLSNMSGTVAPGKWCVMAFKKRMPLVMESPMIRVVGAKRGRGDDVCELPGQDSGHLVASVCNEDGSSGWRVCAGGQQRGGLA